MRLVVLLPGRETPGFAKGFCGEECERERNRDATCRSKRDGNVRKLLAVRCRESIAADVDSVDRLLLGARFLVSDRS